MDVCYISEGCWIQARLLWVWVFPKALRVRCEHHRTLSLCKIHPKRPRWGRGLRFKPFQTWMLLQGQGSHCGCLRNGSSISSPESCSILLLPLHPPRGLLPLPLPGDEGLVVLLQLQHLHPNATLHVEGACVDHALGMTCTKLSSPSKPGGNRVTGCGAGQPTSLPRWETGGGVVVGFF